MSLKEEVSLSINGEAVVSHTGELTPDPAAAGQSSISPTIERQLSLHAHPRQDHPPRLLSKNHHTQSKDVSSTSASRLGIELLKRRAGLNPQNLRRKVRRSELASQGTVIINHEVRERRQNAQVLQAHTATADEEKTAAEQKYYEQRDHSGQTRRRSMLRTVSKEDYLFGRGANPRTGLITPGGGSIDSNIDGTVIPSGSNIPYLAKWRQKGDQWVSLDIDEPTPVSYSADDLCSPLPKPKRARTPQRFIQWNSSVPNFMTSSRKSSIGREPSRSAAVGKEVESLRDTESVPGSFPDSPPKWPAHDRLFNPTVDASIRRKPVGTSPPKEEFIAKPAAVMDQHVQAPNSSPQLSGINVRSFSAPSRPFTPINIGKELPKLPSQRSNYSGEPDAEKAAPEAKTFLDLDPKHLNRINPPYIDSPTLGWTDQREGKLCLQMSYGPYPQTLSVKSSAAEADSRLPDRLRLTQASLQRQTDSSITTKPGSRRSHIAEMMITPEQSVQIHNTDPVVDQNVYAVPNYDNPPRNMMPRPSRPLLSGPRSMPQPQHATGKRLPINSVSTDPFSTTSTNTDMFTRTRKNHGLRHTNKPRIPPTFHSPPARPVPPVPIHGARNRDVHPQTVMTTASENLTDLSPPRAVPRGMERPHVPSRAVGLHQIPQINGTQDVQARLRTELQHRSNMTGMSIGDLLHDQSSSYRPSVDIPLAQSGPQCLPGERITADTMSDRQLENIPLPRRCSRCLNGLVTSTAVSIDGQMASGQLRRLSASSAHAPEVFASIRLPTPIPEVSEPSTSRHTSLTPVHPKTTSATILNVQDDLRDHSICCPDCCKLDCHEGCLGHPSSATSPIRNTTQVEKSPRSRADSTSTLESMSGASSSSKDGDEKKAKLSFVKAAFRLPFWHRRYVEAPKNGGGIPKDQELSNSMLVKPQTKPNLPKVSDSVKGHDSAVAAAKRAIGLDSHNGSPENGPAQLTVSRKRPKSRDILGKAIYQDDDASITLAPSPLTPTVKISITANECRKISSSRPCSGNQSTAMLHPSQTRTVSSLSMESRVPSMDLVSSVNMSEYLFIVPFEATRMWLHNNPQVIGFGWSALDCGWAMGCTITVTTKILLRTLYVYSKSGKFRVKDAGGNKMTSRELLIDSVRSSFYLLILVLLFVLLVRVVKIAVLPLRLLISIGRYLIVGGRRIEYT